jgi:hypothetical protein
MSPLYQCATTLPDENIFRQSMFACLFQNFELAVKVLTNSSVLTLNSAGDIVVKKSTNKYNTFLSQMFEPFLLGYWVSFITTGPCQDIVICTIFLIN